MNKKMFQKAILFSLFLFSVLIILVSPGYWQSANATDISFYSLKDVKDKACSASVISSNICSSLSIKNSDVIPTIDIVGAVGYATLAKQMAIRNPLGEGLTEREKNFLRPYMGNIVDRVVIHYDAVLANEFGIQKVKIKNANYFWEPPNSKLTFGDKFGGQTFGRNIYVSRTHSTQFSLVALLGHEIVHSMQYEQLGSDLAKFGATYFSGYADAGFSYENNWMEKQAYNTQYKIIENQCASANFSGQCPSQEKSYLDSYDFDYANIPPSFNLNGDSSYGNIPSGSDKTLAVNTETTALSTVAQSALAAMISSEDQGDYTSCLSEHIIKTLVRCDSNPLPFSYSIYDPSAYRPGTSGWTGKTAKASFYNGSSNAVIISLYHPDAPSYIFKSWNVAPGQNLLLGTGYYGMDWGIQVNNSPVFILGRVSAWNKFNNEYIFQTGYPFWLHN